MRKRFDEKKKMETRAYDEETVADLTGTCLQYYSSNSLEGLVEAWEEVLAVEWAGV